MHASSTILRTLHDSVFRFSFFSKISLSLSLQQSFPPGERDRAPHELKRRGVARRSTRKRVAFHQYRFESENRLEKSRRIVAGRERGLCNAIRILLFTFALPRDDGGNTVCHDSKRQGVGKGRHEGERREKKWSRAIPIFMVEVRSVRERDRDSSPSSNSRRGFELARPRRSGG